MHGDRFAKLAFAALAVIGLVAAVLVFREQIFSPDAPREDAAARSDESAGDGPGPASRARPISAARASDTESAAGVIRGRVRDEAGAAIGGARIRALSHAGAPDSPDDRSAATADSSGRFEITVRGGAPFSVLAEAEGFGPGVERGVRPGDEVDLVLVAELVVDGTVVDDLGAPVKEAAIAWMGVVGGHEVERAATSDEKGKWRLAGLPAREADPFARLSAKAKGFAPYLTWRLWDQTATGVVRYTIVLSRGGSVSGTVADARTGAPIPGARVELVRMGGWLGQPLARRLRSVCGTVADGDGRFRMEGVPAAEGLDDLAWVASARTYSPAVEQAPPVADGHELRVELKLWAAGAVEGRVVDPNGRPLSGVRTAVKHWYSSYLPARSPFDGPEGVVTGPDGAFRIEAPSSPHGVHLTAARESGQRGFAGAGPFVVAAGATTAVPDLVMELRPAALLRVADLLDRPVAGALIEVPASRPEMRTFFTGADGRVLVSFERWGDGWQGVPAAVRISARGYVEQAVESFVPDSSDPPEVRVSLSRAAELRCHATWSDGSDAAGITVRVAAATAPIASIWPVRGEPPAPWDAPGALAAAETDSTGRCRLAGIPAPPWHVAAWLEARDKEPSVRVESALDPSEEVLLRLSEPPPESRPSVETVDVQVTVLDAASGKPVLDAGVYLDQHSALPTAPGVYRRTVPKLVTRVFVSARDYVRPFEKKVDFAVPGNERIEVRLDSGVTIRGRAKLPPDVSTTGAEISCSWSDRGRRAAPLLPSGEFELRGVASGVPLEFLVQTAHSPKGAWNFVPMPFRPVEVPTGFREMAVDLELVPATHVYLTLTGLPYSAGGDGWDMAIAGTAPEWNRNWRVTGVQFRAVLPMGSATARCEVRGYAPVVESLDLKSDASYQTIQIR